MSSLIFVIFLFNSFTTKSEIIRDELTTVVKQNLEVLCPEVDICDENATSATTRLNRMVGERGIVSCCLSCSCHADCHEHLNCCFLKNKTDKLNERIITPEEPKHVKIENSMLLKECMYVVTGTPDDSWAVRVSSYYMVSKPPKGGCSTTLPLTDPFRTNDTCDNYTAPWGKLYPVYSKERNTIFVNELCARCYGVDKFIKWNPLLVCDPYDNVFHRTIPWAEYIDFTNTHFSRYCHVEFLFNNERVLEENRCYVKTVSHCETLSHNGSDFVIPTGVNMTPGEIIAACHSGLYSPVKRTKFVYSNAFCAICNDAMAIVPFCSFDTESWRVKGLLAHTFLLDASFIEEHYFEEDFTEIKPHPNACFIGEQGVYKCRELFCPSGQIRGKDGQCQFPSKRVFNIAFQVTVKLEYVTRNVSILTMFKSNRVNSSLIRDRFQATSPWTSHWSILKIMHTVEREGQPPEQRVAIEIGTEITRLDIVTQDIEKMADTWTILLDNVKIEFRQKFLEYALKNNETKMLIPMWKFIIIHMKLTYNLSLKPSVWIIIYSYRIFFSGLKPYAVTNLHICDQVALQKNEYYLLEDNILMFNNLTNRFMFENEFDLVIGDNGKLVPRVCISDTTLDLIQNTSQAFLYGVDQILLGLAVFTFSLSVFYQSYL